MTIPTIEETEMMDLTSSMMIQKTMKLESENFKNTAENMKSDLMSSSMTIQRISVPTADPSED